MDGKWLTLDAEREGHEGMGVFVWEHGGIMRKKYAKHG
jgi:hypothetical protein